MYALLAELRKSSFSFFGFSGKDEKNTFYCRYFSSRFAKRWKCRIVLWTITLLLPMLLFGQVAIEWEQSFGTPNWESALDAQLTNDGGVILAGYRITLENLYGGDNGVDATYQIAIDNRSTQLGQSLCLDVKASGFTGIQGIDWMFRYNPSLFEFTGMESLNLPGLTPNDFNQSTAGTVAVRWSNPDGNGLDLPDETVIFQLCFRPLEERGMDTIYLDRAILLDEQGTSLPLRFVNPVLLINDEGYGNADFLVIKLDAEGRLEWEHTYGGSGDEIARSVRQTNDGGYVLTGDGASIDGDMSVLNGGNDFWVVKLDPQGNLMWERSFGGSSFEVGWAMQLTSDGGFIVAGSATSTDGDVSNNQESLDYWIIKLNEAGNLEWEKNYGGSDYDEALAVLQTKDGGYLVGGQSFSADGDRSASKGMNDYWVLKLDSKGDLEWERAYGGSGRDVLQTIKETREGNFVLMGYSDSDDGDATKSFGDFDYWILEIGPLGAIRWQQSTGSGWLDWGYSVDQTRDGGYMLAGSTNGNNGEVQSNHGGFDIWLSKLDKRGQFVWGQNLGGRLNENARAVLHTDEGGYFVVGSSSSSDQDVAANAGDFDVWVVKLIPDCVPDTVYIDTILCAAAELQDNRLLYNRAGCDSLIIYQSVILPAAAVGEDFSSCIDSAVIEAKLDVPGLSGYWSSDDPGLSFLNAEESVTIVSGLKGGENRLRWIQSGEGCPEYTSDELTIYRITAEELVPKFDLGSDTILCASQQLSLDFSSFSADVYRWQDGFEGPARTLTEAGLYTVTIIKDGCQFSDSIQVDYHPPILLELGGDRLLCSDTAIVLDATIEGGIQYTWQDRSKQARYEVQQAGTYSVTVEDQFGCKAFDAVKVQLGQVELFDLGPDTTLCAGETLTLDMSRLQGRFRWQDGTTSSVYEIDRKGRYWLNLTNGQCTFTDTIKVNFQSGPGINLGPDRYQCEAEGLTLNAASGLPGSKNFTYFWQDGSIDSTLEVNQSGTYSVTVTNLSGCSTIDEVQIVLGSPFQLADDAYQLSALQDHLYFNPFANDQLGPYLVTDKNLEILEQPEVGEVSYNSVLQLFEYILPSGQLEVGKVHFRYQLCVDACLPNCQTAEVEIELPNIVLRVSPGVLLDDPTNGLILEGLEEFPKNDLLIFNRWGDVVHKERNYSNFKPWVGRNQNGAILPEGAYFIQLTIRGEEEKIYKTISLYHSK